MGEDTFTVDGWGWYGIHRVPESGFITIARSCDLSTAHIVAADWSGRLLGNVASILSEKNGGLVAQYLNGDCIGSPKNAGR